ncbi:MAG: (Fe-S)-binding protein [Deltaproteobacteria bacterium]|nr:(Fe-S)-binding protein [Deltaproteobacteria bacterium]
MAPEIRKVLDAHHREIEFCTFCPKMCRFACPVANATSNETFTPWGRQSLLHLVSEGHIEFNREIAYVMYQCASCGLCQEYCDHGIDVPPVMLAAREYAVSADLEPHEVAEFRQFWSQHNNPYGDDLRARLRQQVSDEYFVRDAQAVYFAGCGSIYHHPSVLQDTCRVFEAMRIDYVSCYEGEAMCCGAPLRQLGLRAEYEKNAKRLAGELSRYKTIISGSPQCVYELKFAYAQLGLKMPPRIHHISEFLWPLIEEGRLRVSRTFPQSAMYHDPCVLSRQLGVTEEPRNILKHVLREPLTEFSQNGRKSECCGGFGGLTVTNPDAATAIANSRLEEAREHPQTVLITSCSNCRRQFESVEPQLEVLDLVNVLARCV